MAPMRRRPLHPAFAATLVAALLFVQALGLLHRVWHAPGLVEVQAAVFDGHHHDAPDCRLLDQLAQADVLTGAPALPVAHPQPRWWPQPQRRLLLAAEAVAALARGPPAA